MFERNNSGTCEMLEGPGKEGRRGMPSVMAWVERQTDPAPAQVPYLLHLGPILAGVWRPHSTKREQPFLVPSFVQQSRSAGSQGSTSVNKPFHLVLPNYSHVDSHSCNSSAKRFLVFISMLLIGGCRVPVSHDNC